MERTKIQLYAKPDDRRRTVTRIDNLEGWRWPTGGAKPGCGKLGRVENNVDFGQPGGHGTFYGQALQIESASFYVRRLGGGLDDVQTRRRL